MATTKIFEVPTIVAEGIKLSDYNHEREYPHSQESLMMDVPGFSHFLPEAYTTTVAGKYTFILRKAVFFATNQSKLEKAVRDTLKSKHLYNGGINWVTLKN